jgi:hypothetical protein
MIIPVSLNDWLYGLEDLMKTPEEKAKTATQQSQWIYAANVVMKNAKAIRYIGRTRETHKFKMDIGGTITISKKAIRSLTQAV